MDDTVTKTLAENKRSHAELEVDSLRYRARNAFLDGRNKRAADLSRKADLLAAKAVKDYWKAVKA